MITRRGALVESMKFAGLFAAAAFVAGCGEDNSGGTATNKISAEQEAAVKKSEAATAEFYSKKEAEKKK